MSRAQFTNNASTTLAAGINNAVTSMTVVTGTGALFPSVTSYFYCTLKEGSLLEIVKVTARTTDTFTIMRAQEGTTAQAFTTAASVYLDITAAAIAELQDVLVSGANIKTVGGTSLLGSGDIALVAALPVVIVTLTTQTATAGNHYVLTNVAATTLTLPATPASGDTVAVTPDNALTTNIIARNGQTIMGLAEDMTLDNATATLTLRFLNSTWRII